jgi:GAF domain-containing protein
VGPAAELILGREPDTVPRARVFVRSSLAGEPEQLIGNAELVVSELVTNATLHGEPPIIVRLSLENGVRVEVEDAGRGVPILVGQNREEAMTGRGLSMVDMVSSSWGVEPLADGHKVVWAELSGDGRGSRGQSRPEVDIESLLAVRSDDRGAPVTYRVELGRVSTELLLAAKSHIDNVVRELVLLRKGEASSGIALPAQMAALVDTVTVDFADARAEIKRQAAASAGRGDAVTDLVLDLPPSAADAGERYLAALDQADRYARSAHLLTLAPPPEHRLFRRWYVQSLVDQVRARARGEDLPPPRAFELVLADEVARLSPVEHVSARLELLHKVNSDLAASHSPEQMARVVVDNAIEFLGVESAVVHLLGADNVLRATARRGAVHPEQPDVPDDLPLDSDSPIAQVARSSQPVFSRAFPQPLGPQRELAGQYRAGRTAPLIPLIASGLTLGVLSLGFVDGELTEEAETALAQALGDALAEALNRARLATSESEKQAMLRFLAGAIEIMVSAREPVEVLERLAEHAVPELADWCTVYLADGRALRRIAMAIDGHPEVAERLKTAPPVSLDVNVPQTRSFLTGGLELILEGTDELLGRLYPGLEISDLGGGAGEATGLCAPIVIRGQRIGVIAMTYLNSGRQVTPYAIEAIVGLASRAAIALDNAQRWSDQHQVLEALVGSLLPPTPPTIPGLTFAARYLPAVGDVAGDWWEADLMPDGTILVGLGDAAGHGLAAVTQMCELRHGARALAAVESSPAALLADLNRRLAEPDAGFATAVYGRLHPTTGQLRWASAGHVPPLLVHRQGPTTVLEAERSTALGTPRLPASQDQHLVLQPGETLVLYTDGVVERRRASIDDGIARLVATVDHHRSGSLDELADIIIEKLCAHPLDDCCLLLIRRDITG